MPREARSRRRVREVARVGVDAAVAVVVDAVTARGEAGHAEADQGPLRDHGSSYSSICRRSRSGGSRIRHRAARDSPVLDVPSFHSKTFPPWSKVP